MALEQRTPRGVPDLGRMLRRADDVGEQHRRQDAFGFLRLTDPRQEPLTLAHRLRVDVVIDPREETVETWQLSELASSDPLCNVFRLGTLFGLAQNQRWHAHRGQDVAHVRVLHRPEKRERSTWAEAAAHMSNEPLLEGVVVRQAGGPLAQQLGEVSALSPAFPHRGETLTPFLLARRPRIVRGPRAADGRFKQDEPRRALGIRRREQERGPRAFMRGPQHRAL